MKSGKSGNIIHLFGKDHSSAFNPWDRFVRSQKFEYLVASWSHSRDRFDIIPEESLPPKVKFFCFTIYI